MALRHFPRMSLDFLHENPDYEEELEQVGMVPEPGSEGYLFLLLFTSYDRLAARFKAAAMELKEKVVAETWGGGRNGPKKVEDFTLYTGVLGTALLLFKSFQITDNEADLRLASEIVKACDSASLQSRDVTFLCGRAGVCALGAVVAKSMGDDKLKDYYLAKFNEIELPMDLPDGFLHGRAGYLWACAFIVKHLGAETIPPAKTVRLSYLSFMLCYSRYRVGTKCFMCYLLAGSNYQTDHSQWKKIGRKGRKSIDVEWNGKKYWGAAHGLAGIMYILMHFELQQDELEDVRATLLYMIKNRFPSGNYRSCEEDGSDVLVHWCHGAASKHM